MAFGAACSLDYTSTAYNRLRRTTGATDQRGVVNDYTYGPDGSNGAGQVTLDSVASLGDPSQDVNPTVQAIGTSYDDLGRVSTVTSYAGPDTTRRGCRPGPVRL